MHNTIEYEDPWGVLEAKAGRVEREQALESDKLGHESQLRSPPLQFELGQAAWPLWPSSFSSEKWCWWWSPCYSIEIIFNTHAAVKPLHQAPSEHYMLVIRNGGEWAWQPSWGQTAKRAMSTGPSIPLINNQFEIITPPFPPPCTLYGAY